MAQPVLVVLLDAVDVAFAPVFVVVAVPIVGMGDGVITSPRLFFLVSLGDLDRVRRTDRLDVLCGLLVLNVLAPVLVVYVEPVEEVEVFQHGGVRVDHLLVRLALVVVVEKDVVENEAEEVVFVLILVRDAIFPSKFCVVYIFVLM